MLFHCVLNNAATSILISNNGWLNTRDALVKRSVAGKVNYSGIQNVGSDQWLPIFATLWELWTVTIDPGLNRRSSIKISAIVAISITELRRAFPSVPKWPLKWWAFLIVDWWPPTSVTGNRERRYPATFHCLTGGHVESQPPTHPTVGDHHQKTGNREKPVGTNLSHYHLVAAELRDHLTIFF